MSNFKRDGKFKGKKFGGRRGGFGGGFKGGRDRRDSYDRSDRGDRFEKELFDSICAECGKACQVPFKPNGRKPVLCSDCFRNSDGGAGQRDFSPRGPRSSRPNNFTGNQPDLSEINRKLDQILELLGQAEID